VKYNNPQQNLYNDSKMQDAASVRPELATRRVLKVFVAAAEQLQKNSLLDVHVLVYARSS